MSERDEYPYGVPCWVDTSQPDPQAAVHFYGELFGWQFMGPGPIPDDPFAKYFVARVRGRDVAGVVSQPPQVRTAVWNTHVAVESVANAAEKVKSAGGTVIFPPFDVLPAGRIAVLSDPAGAVFCAWEAEVREGAQLVNEPRAWAMSALLTPDPDRAKEFYGEVFGWATDTFGEGDSKIWLWRRPGYVGGEPKQPVPRDVVGVMRSTRGDPSAQDVPPNWQVDFWVDDTDAIAAKAAQLGGKVVVPPYSTPAFRSSIIADPQGAVFSVSHLIAA